MFFGRKLAKMLRNFDAVLSLALFSSLILKKSAENMLICLHYCLPSLYGQSYLLNSSSKMPPDLDSDYDEAIEKVLSQEKKAVKYSKKQRILNQTPRLRNNNVTDNNKENECSDLFVTQETCLSAESQSHSLSISQDSTFMHLLELKLNNMAEKITTTYKKIEIVEENVSIIISMIENIAFQTSPKRKAPKKDKDGLNATWTVMIGTEDKPIYLGDQQKSGPKLRQSLDRHMDVNLIAKYMASPYILGITLADYMISRDIQMKFKFYQSLTRTFRRSPMPENKMRIFKQSLMYCGMEYYNSKIEGKLIFSTVVEAINNKDNHWRCGDQRLNFNVDNTEFFGKVSTLFYLHMRQLKLLFHENFP
uniref:DUF4806 domain-containing protein n=1 Tax=Strongyloides venezuelensis TaxID=75913 RepID=A0A0K0FQH1_STRVS